MSKEYWEEIQLEDLYNRFKEEGYTDEMTICDYCHQDLKNELHEEGWKHDEDEDCDWF